MRYILLILLATHAFGSEGVTMHSSCLSASFGGSSLVFGTCGGSSPGSGIIGGSSSVPGVSGVGSVANSLFSMSQQKYPVPDFSHLEREIQTARDGTQKLVEQLKVAQSTLAFYTSDESKQRSRELALELARTQRLVDTPPAERLARVANALIQRRSLEVQRKLEGPLRDYESKELRDEIRDWKLFSKDKKQVLDTINDFSAEASRLQDASSVESIYVTLSNAALQSSLDSLTEAAQIAGGHPGGSFTEAFEISRSTYEIGKAILDVGLGITPGIGFAKDCYESLLGRSLIDNSPLDITSRASAVLGVATLGGSNIIKSSFKGLIKLGQSLRKSGVLGRGFNKAVHVVDSAVYFGNKSKEFFKDFIDSSKKILGNEIGSVGKIDELIAAARQAASKASSKVLGKVHKGTFSEETKSLAYHLFKHGKGRTAEQYIKDAEAFFVKNKHLGEPHVLADGTKGIKIRLKITEEGSAVKRIGGYFTEGGKVATFWD